MESLHPEGDSPFVRDVEVDTLYTSTKGEDFGDEDYIECPMDGCGEAVLLTDLESHIEMHRAEDSDAEAAFFEDGIETKRVNPNNSSSNSNFQTELPEAIRNLDDARSSENETSENRQAVAKAGWREILNMPSTLRHSRPQSGSTPRKRLGVSELSSCVTSNITNTFFFDFDF